MFMTDPIADMLSRIRNALIANHNEVAIPHSIIKSHIANVLKEEGYITGVESTESGIKKFIKLQLKYSENRQSVINEMKRISKPSRRVYVNKGQIPRVKAGMGITILSTSKGIMTGTNARKIGVGGEIICTVI
ncbi:MAG: 30S ribosomal protein S8 [Thermodesulfobacteriota bacterium]